MSSLSEVPPHAETDTRTETPNRFKRKLLTNRVPRRYILALFLFILQIIHYWIITNDVFALTAVLFVSHNDEDIPEDGLAQSGNWTGYELDSYFKGSSIADIFVQIPGALLIFVFSSHKYLLVSTVIMSILHMLTPVATSHHSVSLVILLYIQVAASSPVDIAILSVWKDWAPSSERSTLVVFSFAGSFLMAVASNYYAYIISYNLREEYFYYAGFSGLLWAVFWYSLTSDTPQNDPLISERELLYLEGNIPSDIQEKIKITDVPWKSILTSKQVIILCLIFVKMSFAFSIIVSSGEYLHFSEFPGILNVEICFIFIFATIMPCSAILADHLIKKFCGRTLLIRKCFLCGGFILQSVFLLGSFSTSTSTKTIWYFTAYSLYAASLPGFFTIPLDLSPRYVTIISGIIFTGYYIGNLCMDFILDSMLVMNGPHVFSWILLIDAVIGLICAVLFGVWGEVEEQVWSLSSTTRSRPEGYKSYPRADDADDMSISLVPKEGDGDIF